MAIDWPALVHLVRSHERFLLTSHIRPDCDALGSELGMAGILRALGKDVLVVNAQATPPNLAFLDPHRQILTLGSDIQVGQLADRQLLIVLDTSAWVQLGAMAEVVKTTPARKVILDHHLSADDLQAVAFKDVSAEATGRLVVEAADQLGVPLNAEIARPLYAALATDTGWFRFGSTRSDTYRLAARLVDAGADPAGIYADLYEQETLARCRLRGVILSRLQTELDGRLVYTYVREPDFTETGALAQDTEDAINLSLAIAGTRFAVIFVEQPTGGCKLSFRSRCAVDCSQIAAAFGGGGHKAAAGAFLDEPFEVAQARVLEHVRQALANEN